VPTNSLCFFDLRGFPGAVPLAGLSDTVGYILPYGQGSICVLGLDPSAELLAFVCRLFDVRRPASPAPAGLMIAPFVHKDEIALVAVNTNKEPVSGPACLDLEALGLEASQPYRVRELLRGSEQVLTGAELRDLPLALEGKDGRVCVV
jgi:hypothetical protein